MKTFLKSSPPLNQCLNLSDLLGQFKLKLLSYQRFVLHRRSSYIKGCLSSKLIFHWRLHSIEDRSSIKGFLPSKVFFHQRPSSAKGYLPSRGFFHERSSKLLLHRRFVSVPSQLPSNQRVSCSKYCLQRLHPNEGCDVNIAIKKCSLFFVSSLLLSVRHCMWFLFRGAVPPKKWQNVEKAHNFLDPIPPFPWLVTWYVSDHNYYIHRWKKKLELRFSSGQRKLGLGLGLSLAKIHFGQKMV